MNLISYYFVTAFYIVFLHLCLGSIRNQQIDDQASLFGKDNELYKNNNYDNIYVTNIRKKFKTEKIHRVLFPSFSSIFGRGGWLEQAEEFLCQVGLPTWCICNEQSLRRKIDGWWLFGTIRVIPPLTSSFSVCYVTETIEISNEIDITGKSFFLSGKKSVFSLFHSPHRPTNFVATNNNRFFRGIPRDITIEHIHFQQGVAEDGNGGAIQITGGGGGKFHCSFCQFTNNRAEKNGGAVSVERIGVFDIPAIYFSGRTTFDNNQATLKGGAIYSADMPHIYFGHPPPMDDEDDSSASFQSNIAGEDGSAVYMENYSSFTSSATGSNFLLFSKHDRTISSTFSMKDKSHAYLNNVRFQDSANATSALSVQNSYVKLTGYTGFSGNAIDIQIWDDDDPDFEGSYVDCQIIGGKGDNNVKRDYYDAAFEVEFCNGLDKIVEWSLDGNNQIYNNTNCHLNGIIPNRSMWC